MPASFAGAAEADISWPVRPPHWAYSRLTPSWPTASALGAADQGDLDVAATIGTYAGWLGVMVQTFEPIAWAR